MGEPAHVEVPWEALFDSILKINVKIPYSKLFVYYEKYPV